MILVALVVVVATACGIVYERRSDVAPPVARGCLRLMLYALIPFVAFVNLAHLHLTVGAGAGLIFAYVAVGSGALVAWAVGRYRLGLPAASLGAVIAAVIIANTGYLGFPLTDVLLGASHLGSAVAYDQLVNGPMLYIGGFAVGAAFGTRSAATGLRRLRAFITRNPPMIAAIAGLLSPASLAPPPLLHASHIIVAGLLPLGFFTVGVFVSAQEGGELEPLLRWPGRAVALAVGLRLLWAPLVLVAFSLTTFRLPSAYVLEAGMPTGITALVVGEAFGLDQRLISRTIVWGTGGVLIVALAVASGLFGHAR